MALRIEEKKREWIAEIETTMKKDVA